VLVELCRTLCHNLAVHPRNRLSIQVYRTASLFRTTLSKLNLMRLLSDAHVTCCPYRYLCSQ